MRRTATLAITALLALSGTAAAGVFNDVGDRFYTDAVDWAYYHGITTGTNSYRFEPDRPVTRGELVTMLYRYDQALGPDGLGPVPPCGIHLAVLPADLQPDAAGWTLECYEGRVPYPFPDVFETVGAYYNPNTATIHLWDGAQPWVIFHEVAHHLLGHTRYDPTLEAEANCLANELIGWAPHPDCGGTT